MAGKTSFRQPIRHGIDTGVPSTSTLGYAVITQLAEISAGDNSFRQVFNLPGDTEGGPVTVDILGIDIVVKDVFEASAAAVMEFSLGSAAGVDLGDVRVSGVGIYKCLPGQAENNNGNRTTTVSADAMFNITRTDRSIWARVSAAGTPADTGFGYLVVHYVAR